MRRIGWTLPALLLIAFSGPPGFADEPRPSSLARYFPAKDLVAYVEFDGIDAHAEVWKKTAASKILSETPTGAMLDKVARQMVEAVLKAVEEGEKDEDDVELPSFDDASTIVRQLVRSGFAFGINRKADDPSAKPSCIGLVFRGVGKGPLRGAANKILAAIDEDDEAIRKIDGVGGRKISAFGEAGGPSMAWWFEGDDLVCCFMDVKYSEAMIAALEGREPNAVEHPLRKELAATVDGFEPNGLAFFDARALPEMPPEAKMFGLDGIKRVDVRWGFRGEALESLTRIVAPSPRTGVLAMFDQPTFDSKSLPPLPGGVGSFTTASIDLLKVFDQGVALAGQASPELRPAIQGVVDMFAAGTGRRLREDILAKIGPRVVLADVPTRVLVSTNPFGSMVRGMARVPRLSILVEIKDRAQLLKDLDSLADWVNEQFPIPKDPKAGDKPAPKLVRRLKNVEGGYEIALSPTYWPLPAGYRPSLVVGEKYLSLGTTPDVARLALRGEGELDGPMTRALASLPGEMTLLSVNDARNSALPEILANIPSLIQWWAFAFQSVQLTESIQVNRTPRAINVPAGTPARIQPIGPAPAKIEIKVTAPTVVEPVPAPQAPQSAVVVVNPPAPQAPQPPVVAPTPVVTAVPAAFQPPQAPIVVAPAPADPSVKPAERAVAKDDDEDEKPEAAKKPEIAFRLRLDPDEIPTPEEIRALLFPATYSLSVDAQGFRFATREALPAWNPTSLIPLAISGALPIFQEVQASTKKDRASANLLKIHAALMAYHEDKGHFPAPATLDKEGKPLLSWRVELLPFMGEQSLYDEFHRDEPWDSLHNKALIARMPAAFAHPSAKAEPGMTFYRGVIGKGAFFDPEVKEGINLAAITDGTSDTLVLVEAREAVPWTKPGTEIPFEGDPMLSKLGGHAEGGFSALFADGSVEFLRDSIKPEALRAISTRAKGETISRESDSEGVKIRTSSPDPSPRENLSRESDGEGVKIRTYSSDPSPRER